MEKQLSILTALSVNLRPRVRSQINSTAASKSAIPSNMTTANDGLPHIEEKSVCSTSSTAITRRAILLNTDFCRHRSSIGASTSNCTACLVISSLCCSEFRCSRRQNCQVHSQAFRYRSEEHTSELQS